MPQLSQVRTPAENDRSIGLDAAEARFAARVKRNLRLLSGAIGILMVMAIAMIPAHLAAKDFSSVGALVFAVLALRFLDVSVMLERAR